MLFLNTWHLDLVINLFIKSQNCCILSFSVFATKGSLFAGEIQAMTENVAVQEIPSRDIAFTTNNMPFDLSVDGLSGNAISINSVGELEGLLGPSIDVSSLMGGGLVTQLGIAGSTFPDGFEGITASEGHVSL